MRPAAFARLAQHRCVAPVAKPTVRGLSRVGLVRWAGFGATCVIAVGAYGAGASASGDPAPTLRVAGFAATTPRFQIGSLLVVVGCAWLIAVWWRLCDGLRAAAPGTARGLVATAVLWALPLLAAPPLASRDVYSYACQGWLFGSGHSPYAVSPLDGRCPWTEAVAPTWQDSTAPYGAAGIAVATMAAALSRPASSTADVQLLVFVAVLRVLILVALLLAAAAGARLARRCGVPPAQAAAVGLLTPLVALHGVSGAHLDVIVLALVVGGLWAATVRVSRAGTATVVGPALAGVLVGLAVAVKVSAVVVLPFVAILAAQAGSRDPVPTRRRVLVAVLPVVGSAVATVSAVTAVLGLDYGWVTALSDTADMVQWTSPPTAVGMCAGYVLRLAGRPELFDPTVSATRLVGLLLLVAALVLLVVRAWRRRATTGAVVATCGSALAASVALAPVFYPWYALTPLAVLALSTSERRGVRAIMVATTVPMLLVIPNGLGVAALTKAPGAFALTTALVTALIVHLRRSALDRRSRPQRRPVGSRDRPAGGSPCSSSGQRAVPRRL